ncbi:SET domain-containing protein SmydA-8-like [Pollicipes pollicipes]|uniref:SET domain-containing protein SmydA-8-like n=1 Tax=Pollicipes pollicipes TaxID=41117 RepID=UPI0018855224|nr:SET domain-containing protein SmydA-8-like [Pollicipes pollicipes]
MSSTCARCGGPAQLRCAACSVPYYCTRQRPGVGRFTVAARNLAAGQLLLNEAPLASGPQLEAEPQCLSCGRLLEARAAACARCRWPMCGESCAASAAHAAECAVLARDAGDRPKAGSKPSARYDCILPLRLLLLRDQPRIWDKLTRLETHVEQRRDTAIYRDNQCHVVDYLRQRCAVDADEELLHRLCGVLDVNAFSLRPKPGFGRRRGLFARTSLLNHSCVSNTQLSLDGEVMQVRASLPILSGNEVTAAYISAYDPTARRHDFLRNGKYFQCGCERCRDPSELETHFGSHRCGSCRELVMSTDPLSPDAVWRCSGCGREQPASEVRQLNARLQAERQGLAEGSVQDLEDFIGRHGEFPLHPGNYHVVAVKQMLAQMYGNAPGHQLEQLSNGRLVAKEKFCRQMIALTVVFEPGLSRMRGLLLLQLHHAVVTLAQRRFAESKISPTRLLESLEEGGRFVAEAISLLRHEPASTPEGGAMMQMARDTLQGCFEMAELVRSSIGNFTAAG